MEKILLGVLIGMIGLTAGLSYGAYSDDYLEMIEFAWKFDNGFYADPESEYSKFLESIGGSTMIKDDEYGR